MGVLNATPDSFSDGGLFLDPDRAFDHVERMIAEGADLIDVGGESTRPGATPLGVAEEIARVVPLIRKLRPLVSVPISVDTRRVAVARAALAEGADIVNDVSALDDSEMAEVIAETGAAVVLMHMRGTPATMQTDPHYDDVVREVTLHLESRVHRAIGAGIARDRIAVDPGIGFGKTLAHNLTLVSGLQALAVLGRPIVLGVSRKAFLGTLLGGAPASERDVATAAACVVGLLRGARIFRVHDVGIVRQALTVAHAMRPDAPISG